MNEILTTYLPSVLLVLITYGTTHLPSYYFEAAVTVNLTNMLVLTTLFISVMQKLPPTSYIKLVDVWLIVCQLFPFLQVTNSFIMEKVRDGLKQKKRCFSVKANRLFFATPHPQLTINF